MSSTGERAPQRAPERIVGREEELRVLEEALASASRGGSPCVTVAGEPGIGKTALLDESCRRAAGQGFLVAAGGATEYERHVPFALAAEALDGLLASEGTAALERLGPERTARLVPVLPALVAHAPEAAPGRGSASEAPPRLPAERYLLHDAVRRALEALAAKRPLLLALDDVHWADEASLELVAHLLRRPPERAVALLIAHRTQQAPRRLAAALATAAREHSASQLRLGPLAEREGEALLDQRLDPRRRRALYEESGGNPLYLTELARAARADRKSVV